MSISMHELRKLKDSIINSPHKPVESLPPMQQDAVNHPAHYTHSSVEPIDAIEAWKLNFHLGCAVKYIARCEHKGRPIEDLEKARWYLDREIERRKAAGA